MRNYTTKTYTVGIIANVISMTVFTAMITLFAILIIDNL